MAMARVALGSLVGALCITTALSGTCDAPIQLSTATAMLDVLQNMDTRCKSNLKLINSMKTAAAAQKAIVSTLVTDMKDVRSNMTKIYEGAYKKPEEWYTIMKTNGDATFQYDATYWKTTTSTLNPTAPVTATGNAKYADFNTQHFDMIRLCVSSLTNCYTYSFGRVFDNAVQLFNGKYNREGVDATVWHKLFGVSGHRSCNPQMPGFNAVGKGGNAARWGYLNNIPAQGCQGHTADSDGTLGIGIEGQDCCTAGAGWTNYFVNNRANGGKHSRQQAWISVKQTIPGKGETDWVLILKTKAGSNKFQYDSPYWGNSQTYNTGSVASAPGDAKYAAYNSMKFNQIKGCVGSYSQRNTAHCATHKFKKTLSNARTLFNGKYLAEGVDSTHFVSIFSAKGSRQCGPQGPGFNRKANGNNHFRWGFANNIPAQGCQTNVKHDADGTIGWGIKGQDRGATGAGFTNYFVNNRANGGKDKSFDSWIYVKFTN